MTFQKGYQEIPEILVSTSGAFADEIFRYGWRSKRILREMMLFDSMHPVAYAELTISLNRLRSGYESSDRRFFDDGDGRRVMLLSRWFI